MSSVLSTTDLLCVPMNWASWAYSLTMPSTSDAENALLQLSMTCSASSFGPAFAAEHMDANSKRPTTRRIDPPLGCAVSLRRIAVAAFNSLSARLGPVFLEQD